MNGRVYLDWNATAPLRPEARDAMIAAMDVVGNPSSVHAEGRKSKAIIERARAQVAAAFGASGSDIVFTGSATEACALALHDRALSCAGIEHDAVVAQCRVEQSVNSDGLVNGAPEVLQAANSETGVLQKASHDIAFCDAVQAAGKTPWAFEWSPANYAALSAHKIGGPAGIGALLIRRGLDVDAIISGGGQEMGRRSGTENVIGAAGFGAAAEAATRDLSEGVWDRVAEMRNNLEETLADAASEIIFFGKGASRLPNTTNFAIPGWKGETQVMQMDLAGFAVSAGSACSSGKVRESRVLRAMGFDSVTASSAIRVSMGPTTTQAQVTAFADAWIEQYRRFKARAA